MVQSCRRHWIAYLRLIWFQWIRILVWNFLVGMQVYGLIACEYSPGLSYCSAWFVIHVFTSCLWIVHMWCIIKHSICYEKMISINIHNIWKLNYCLNTWNQAFNSSEHKMCWIQDTNLNYFDKIPYFQYN